MVFGNIHQIYDWHRDFFQVELERCLKDQDLLAELFIKHERPLHMYVVYCQNKPHSEFIVVQYQSFFEEIQREISCRMSISDYLIKPVQRITRYQLLLKDFLKYTSKAGLDCKDIEKALQMMSLVPKRCNDMMNIGRLQGYEGKLSSQGKLLEQDTFGVLEQDGGVLSHSSKERRLFLFEHLVMFTEVSSLVMEDHVTQDHVTQDHVTQDHVTQDHVTQDHVTEDHVTQDHVTQDHVTQDLLQFVLWSRGSEERFTLQAPSASVRTSWVEQINQLVEAHKDFLSGQPPSVPPTPNGHAPHDTETHQDQNLVLVLQDFSAVREDEITVVRGDRVQVLSSNQQGQSLVFRPGDSESPPAEGWVPRR
ncbi:hypothetical protein NHX12_015617, partial [Muraenolepis orangiensis]